MHDRGDVAQVLAAHARCWSAARRAPCPRRRSSSLSSKPLTAGSAPRGTPTSSPRPRPSAPASPGRAPPAPARAAAGSSARCRTGRWPGAPGASRARRPGPSATSVLGDRRRRRGVEPDQAPRAPAVGPRQREVAADEVRPHQHVAVDEDQELRLRRGDRPVQDRVLPEARRPRARRGGPAPGCAAAKRSTTARVSGPDPSSAIGDRVRRHRLPRHRGEAERRAPAGSRRWRRSARLRTAPPTRSAPGSRAPPGPRPRPPRCSRPSAAPCARTRGDFAARFGPRPIFAASSASERV